MEEISKPKSMLLYRDRGEGVGRLEEQSSQSGSLQEHLLLRRSKGAYPPMVANPPKK